MEKVLVFGHKTQIQMQFVLQIAYAELKKELGMNAEPVRLGEISGETQFALDYFKVEGPRFC